jgi:CIC family chloride channel protein
MLSEMTLDYRLIIPTTLTVALSYGVRKLIISESIYTLKLVRRGHDLPQALQSNFQYLKRARTMMETSVGVVSSSSTLQEFARTVVVQPTIAYFLVEEQGVVRGIIAREAALKVLEQPGKSITVGEIATTDYVTVTENSTFFNILTRMRAVQAVVAPVGRRSDTNSVDNVQGLITKSQIVGSMEEAVELFTG